MIRRMMNTVEVQIDLARLRRLGDAMRQLVVSALAVGALLLNSANAVAHPGHTHKILGTVTAVTTTSVEVLDRNNEKTTFTITTDTKIRVGAAAGTRKDIRTGLRVSVDAEEQDDERFVALTIQLPERSGQEKGR